MKAVVDKSKIIQKLTDRYDLKHGDWIELERLYDMAEREKIEKRDLLSLLGIPNKRNPDEDGGVTKVKIKLYEKEELEEMQKEILRVVQTLKRKKQKELEEISKRYKINLWILIGMLNNCYQANKPKRKQNRKINAQKEEYELLLEEVKYKDFVTKEMVVSWKQKYKLEDNEIISILETNSMNYRNLMSSKTAKMRIDLLNEKEKKQIRAKITKM